MAIPDLLRELLLAPGPSGHEEEAARVWREAASTFADVHGDTLGTSFARVSGSGSTTLALFGHIDEVGITITHIDGGGLLAFNSLGATDAEMLVGQRVIIAGRAGPVDGVIVAAERRGRDRSALERSSLHIDVGASSFEEAVGLVELGDTGVWRGDPIELPNRRIVSRALDNRLGAYIVLEAARRVAQAGDAQVDVVAVATAQEETSHDGARTAAYGLEPDVALVVDVTWATDVPGGSPRRAGRVDLGGGVTITRGSMLHPAVSDALLRAAREEGIAHAVEVYPGQTHTDADDVQISRSGVPTGLLGIPLRYMHSPCELASLDDVESAIALVVAFARRLVPETSFVR